MSGLARKQSWEPSVAWEHLRDRVTPHAACLRAPAGARRGLCEVCWAPVGPGFGRCFQCELHAESVPGGLADVVVPIAYSVKGSSLARDLWLYKSGQDGALAARSALRALLLVFLHDHGRCVWRQAGMPAATHLCVVPSGRGRPGRHPLAALIAPYVCLPWAGLVARSHDHPWASDLDPDRFAATQPLRGAAVLLLDDTWASGGSAQSASVALRQAGARWVAAVVLGRHLTPGGPRRPAGMPPAGMPPAGMPPAGMPFRLDRCAVHGSAHKLISLDR
jgi:hypothetical protein